MDGRHGGRAGASLNPDRRAVREAARRRRAQRGAAISAVSTVVVLGALAALILTSKGWPNVRDTFFSWSAFKDSFPEVLDGFWLDMKIFVIVEVVVLVLGLVVALARVDPRARAVPGTAARGHLHGHVPRRPDDPVRLPDRLRGARAGAARACPSDPVVLGGAALALSYGAYVAEVYRAGIDSIHPGQRSAALALGLTPDPVHPLRRAAPGRAAGRAAAAQRLHRPAEGRGAGLDPGPARGVPGGADRGLVDLQLHAADRRGASSTWP